MSVIYINSYQFGAAYAPLLLDTYTGAAAAYSLRQLRTGVTNIVRVRRSSDNTEQDFTAAQITDGTLTAFCGAGDGFVRTWYDQSGNAFHAGNGDTTKQPKLVSNGSLLTRGLLFDGTNDSLDCGGIIMPSSSPLFISIVYSHLTGTESGNTEIIGQYSAGITGRTWVSVDSTGITVFSNATNNLLLQSPGLSTSDTLITIDCSSTLTGSLYKNSSFVVSDSISGLNRYQRNTTIGGGPGSSEDTLNGYIKEIIVYITDQSTNRAAIEANINAHYSIF